MARYWAKKLSYVAVFTKYCLHDPPLHPLSSCFFSLSSFRVPCSPSSFFPSFSLWFTFQVCFTSFLYPLPSLPAFSFLHFSLLFSFYPLSLSFFFLFSCLFSFPFYLLRVFSTPSSPLSLFLSSCVILLIPFSFNLSILSFFFSPFPQPLPPPPSSPSFYSSCFLFYVLAFSSTFFYFFMTFSIKLSFL